MQKFRAIQNPSALGFVIHSQQDLQIIWVAKIGMVAVSAFYDVQPFGSNKNRGRKCKGAAFKGTVREGPSGSERKQNFFLKTLIVHITTYFSKPLRCSLLWTEKKVIHMEYIAVIDLLQF